MTRADLTTCGRNILPEPKRSPTTFMPAISGPSMTCSGRSAFWRASSVSASIYSVMPLTSACSRRFSTVHSRQERSCAFASLRAGAAETLGDFEQTLGPIRTAVQHDVFAGLAQFRIDVVVDGKLAGVDDAHVHARLDGVVEEHGMHRLAHRLVAAERERQVGHAAGNMHERHALADRPRRLDEVDAVVVVLFDAGRDREDVRIEDDVFRRKACLLGQQLVGARADFHLALVDVRLPRLVEGHDDDGSAVAVQQPRLSKEILLAFLQRDRVDDRLALNALQTGLDDRELRTSRSSPARGRCPARRRSGCRNSTIAFSESIRPSSMLMSMICAPFST